MDPPEVAIVTLGSSKTFVFEGGPAPWILDPVHFYENLESKQEDIKKITVYPLHGLGSKWWQNYVMCIFPFWSFFIVQ